MYEKAMQVDALQDALIEHYDGNGDGKVEAAEAHRLTRETGLAAKDLTVSCARADPAPLLAAAHGKRLLPERITREVEHAYDYSPDELLRTLRHRNLQKGVDEYESRRAEMWQEIEPHLTHQWVEPRDYLRWETWHRGIERFHRGGREFLRGAVHCVKRPKMMYDTLRMGVQDWRRFGLAPPLPATEDNQSRHHPPT